MKSLILHNKSSTKVVRGERELTFSDLTEEPRGTIPGEWILLLDLNSKRNYLAYINSFSENYFKIKIICEDFEKQFNANSNEETVAILLIENFLKEAFLKRKVFKGYETGSRLVYGSADFLPGLIVDMHEKIILIQINTAGIDRFRNLIHGIIQDSYKSHKVLFLDNVEYRKSEMLPTYESEKLNEDLTILENSIRYKIDKSVVQKNGYYYDHRENRNKLRALLKRSSLTLQSGLDLFCYVGSWGLHLLDSGVPKVDFVDQANMEKVVEENVKLNGYNNKGSFFRSDVFKFLDQAILQNKKYDVIISDPPAFTKSEKNKIQALQGYEKLHTKAMKLLNDKSLFVAASCTHPVGIEELDRTVQEAAFKNNLKVQLLDLGTQGFDHPSSGFKDNGFYIKYLVYYVTRGKK